MFNLKRFECLQKLCINLIHCYYYQLENSMSCSWFSSTLRCVFHLHVQHGKSTRQSGYNHNAKIQKEEENLWLEPEKYCRSPLFSPRNSIGEATKQMCLVLVEPPKRINEVVCLSYQMLCHLSPACQVQEFMWMFRCLNWGSEFSFMFWPVCGAFF